MDRDKLIARFWELQEPDVGAYSRRIDQLLRLLPDKQLTELVEGMDDRDDDTASDE